MIQSELLKILAPIILFLIHLKINIVILSNRFKRINSKLYSKKKKYFRKLMLFLFKYIHVDNSMTRLWIKTCEGFGEIKTKKIERMKVLIEII